MKTFRISPNSMLSFGSFVLALVLAMIFIPAPGICETFSDDFEDPATYLGVAPTKWRQVGVSWGSSFSTDIGSGGIGSSVRLGDTDQGLQGPALAANFAQYYDLSSTVLQPSFQVEVKPNNTVMGAVGIGYGVYGDSGADICASIAAALWYDSGNSRWRFELYDIDDYDAVRNTIEVKTVNIDPDEFYLMTMDRDGDDVTATLATLDGLVLGTVGGVPGLPIDVAGMGIWANNIGNASEVSCSFDNFSMTAEPDNRHMVFGNVEILEDTAADELFPVWSKNDKWLAYIARDDVQTDSWNVWVKQIDPPEDAVKCTNNSDGVYIYARATFGPDNSHVFFTAKNSVDGRMEIKRAPTDGTGVVGDPIRSQVGFNWYVTDVSCNLLVGSKQPHGGISNLFAVELDEDGKPDWTTEKPLTAFSSGFGTWGPHFDATCDRVVFMNYTNLPTNMDLYMLSRVKEILDPLASPAAPTDYDDDKLTVLADGPNPQATGSFSGDGSLVYYCEDTNTAFDFEAPVNNPGMPWLEMMNEGHWEIFAVNPDVPEEKIKLNYYRPYNQGILSASPDGTKLAFVSDNHNDSTPGVVDADIYIVKLEAQANVKVNQGATITDGSGTELVVPENTLSKNTRISVKTPFPGEIPSPETLPGGLQNIALARVIESSKDVTFDLNNPPILTIHYTEAEISGLDEMSLRIYVYNDEDEAEPAFWEAIPMDCDVCGVDPVANTVKGTLTHLSTFCVSGALEGTLPVVGSFKPPLTDETDFTLQFGTTLPVKFDVRTPTGEFLPDEPLEAVVTDSSANEIVTFVRGTGSEDIRSDTTAEHYIFNLHSKNYGLVDGATYTIIILWNGIPIGDIDFVVDYTKGTGRGKKK